MTDKNQQLQTTIRAELRDVDSALTELDKVEAGIAQLTTELAGVVFDVKTPAGMKLAIAGRAAARTPRLEVERIRKVAKAPILELGRNVDGRARKITEQLVALEDPIDAQIKAEEQRKEHEKQERAEAERRRIAAIQSAIAEILAFPSRAVGKSAAEIAHLVELATLEVEPTVAVYAEFHTEAVAAREQSLAKLQALHTAAVEAEAAAEAARVQREAEAEQLRRDREELERLRQADAERRAKQAEEDRIAREAAEKAAAAERAEADRLAAEERARLREKEERQARERRQREDEERRAREEEERAAAEQRGREMAEAARIREIEAQRLAAERADFERRKREQAERELAEQLAKVTLFDAAQDALQLLHELGADEHLVTVKLAKILAREAKAA